MFKVVRFTDDCFLLHSCALSILGVMLNVHVDQISCWTCLYFLSEKNWIWDLVFSGQAAKAGEYLSEASGTWAWSAEESSSWCGLLAPSPEALCFANRPPTLHLMGEGGSLQRKLSEIVSWWSQKSCFLSKEQIELLASMFVKDNYKFQAQSRIL